MEFDDNYLSGFSNFESEEAEIIANKRANMIYVSDFGSGQGKYISMIFQDDEEPYDISMKVSPRIEVRVTYILENDQIKSIKLNKLKGKNVESINISTVSFKGILAILKIFAGLDLKSISSGNIILDSDVIDDPAELEIHLKTILASKTGKEKIQELAQSNDILSKGDIGNIALKKESLKEFESLLHDEEYFNDKKLNSSFNRDEDVWQRFFEKNKWIFGYGLEYIINEPISKDKFQQSLKGHSFYEAGKRPDAVLMSMGIAHFLSIVEIKTHKTFLLDKNSYRNGVWSISKELSGAISQCHQYVKTSAKNIREVVELKDDIGDRTGIEILNFNPKCLLIVGDLSNEFPDKTQNRVSNIDKISCFDYMRKSLMVPEIITFDQLYNRAKYIIGSQE